MNLKRLQEIIEKIGESLPPNDDWMPALILESKEQVTIFGFAGNPMGGSRMKDLVAAQITKCIEQLKPDCACFISTAWSIDFEGKPPPSGAMVELIRKGEIRPSQHPDRIEIVNAYCYGEKGENEGEALMIGDIQRFENSHPKIKKWRIIEEGATAEGRFPEAIQDGFKLARGG